MISDQQPIFASLNLASFYKIELSCQRFINLGTRIVKIGAVINQNTGALKKSKREDSDSQTIFAKQIFGPNRDEVGYCLCGLRKGKNPHTMQVMVRDNDNFYWTTICGFCLMEYMDEAIQMSRMGLIDLPLSVLHIWYVPYISRLLMCNNNFIFNSIYGYCVTIVTLIPGQIKFESRRGSKYIELDGNKVSGVMLSKSVDRLAKYDIAFLPNQYTRYGTRFFYRNLSKDDNTQVPLIPRYRDDPFKIFIAQLKHNQYMGIGTKEFKTEKSYKKFLRSQALKTSYHLKNLRREQAKLVLAQKPETLSIFFRLMRKKTYKHILQLTLKYKILSNWTNLYFFSAQRLKSKRSFTNFQNISSHLLQFKQQRSIIRNFLKSPYGRYDVATTMKVKPKPKSDRPPQRIKFYLKKLKQIKRFKEGIESTKNMKHACMMCGEKFSRDTIIQRYKSMSFAPRQWPGQHNSNIFVRYSVNANSTLFSKDLNFFVPSLLLSNFERNWSYKYQTIGFQESKLTNIVPIYNNYWEISSQSIEKINRECIATFFMSDKTEAFAGLNESLMELDFDEDTLIYENKFLLKPRNVWHNLHLLPFNLTGRSHTSWKEMFAAYTPPNAENVNMLKFMLQNLSDLLLKYNAFQPELTSRIDSSNILFEYVFMATFFENFEQFKSFFCLYLYNGSIDLSVPRSLKFFAKKSLKFSDSRFTFEYFTEYFKQAEANDEMADSFNCWRTTSFIKSENLQRNVKIQNDFLMSHDFRRRARNRMFQTFQRSRNRFEWMILSNIPVLPISLRPLVTVGEGENSVIVRSEINTLYSSIIYRAQWIIRMYQNPSHYPAFLQDLNRILLQQSIENLFGNPYNRFSPESSQNPTNKDSSGLSLLDRLKGKYGRLRRQLLGKRVDYSGRSVIVVGPLLELNTCALPVELGFQIFQPLLIHVLSSLKIAPNLSAAKRMISTSQPRVKECLQNLAQNEIVLLNRAPTLHRMNFQTFYPIITEHKTILLHPLVCSAFNADFDGDQMAVHLPLSIESRLEARIIMMASHNLLSPSTGLATILPTQDMILGCYYLTLEPPVKYLTAEQYMYTLDEIDYYLTNSNFNLHDWVWLQYNGIDLKKKTGNLESLEIRIYENGTVWSIFPKRQKIDDYMKSISYSFLGTTLGRIIFNKVLGFGSSKNF